MEKDYILRMIKQFFEVLATIIHSRNAKRYEQALERIQTASQNFLNTDISFFLQLSPDQLLNYFCKEPPHMDTENGIICADLLYELAIICNLQEMEDEAVRLKILSLNLYVSAILKDVQFQEFHYLKKTQNLLNELNMQLFSENMGENIKLYSNFIKEKS